MKGCKLCIVVAASLALFWADRAYSSLARVAEQGSPCLTNADTAFLHSRFISQILNEGDSVRLAAQGLPYHPADGIMLVSDTTTCQQVVDAYNATVPADSSHRVSGAYVFRVGSSAFAAVESQGSLYVFFDTNYHWLAGIVGMH